MGFDFGFWGSCEVITKLYKLKQTELNQQLIAKKQITMKIDSLEEQIGKTHTSLSTATVKIFGAIGDFKLLAIHKNAMRHEIEKLTNEKKKLQSQITFIDGTITGIQKEIEKYDYILKIQKKELMKKIEKNDVRII